MKLPALLAIGMVIVIGLGVYFLKNPALLYYPAAWAAVGASFFGLNKVLSGSSQPSPDAAEASSD